MLMMQYFGSIRLAWPMPLDANCISQIPSRNCDVILLSLYGRIFIHRWRLHCNIGAADCSDCIWRSGGCCKLPFDVGLFIAAVRKPDASGWHPNYTIPHGWFNMTQRRNLREKQDWWESSCRKALVKFLKVCSSYRDGMVTFYRTVVHLSKAVYVYDTIRSLLRDVSLCIPTSHTVFLGYAPQPSRAKTKTLPKMNEWRWLPPDSVF